LTGWKAYSARSKLRAITEPLVAPRILGVSELMRVPNTATWFATGNNLKLSGDMVRRALLLMLDPKCERSELREFETPAPCLIAQQQRAEFVVAVLTIVRAFIVAGRPRECAPIGSFEDWSGLVCDALIWLGRPDPADAMGEARRADPVLAGLTNCCRRAMEEGDRQGPGDRASNRRDCRGAWRIP
jgi:putative DNA primase/helicase